MRILGIDPGSNCTGYGIVEESGSSLKAVCWGGIRNPAKASFPDRLKRIHDELLGVIETHAPDGAAVEDLFFAVNVKSALKLGQTRGAILLTLANANLDIGEYSPLEIKQAVAGYGRAEKSQVQSMVKTLLNLKEDPEPLDASDALAVAICHIHSSALKTRIAGSRQ